MARLSPLVFTAGMTDTTHETNMSLVLDGTGKTAATGVWANEGGSNG